MSANLGIVVQGRVIYALILREVHTIYGNTTLGYLWAIFQCLVGILFIWGLRTIMGFHPPHGMSVVAFLLSGFLPWYMFSQTLTKCMTAIGANNALLTFPQVTSLDLMISRMIVIWVTQIISGIIVVCFGVIFHQNVIITNFGGLLIIIFFAPLFGLALGTSLGSLAFYWRALTYIVPIFIRIMFITSGVFFSVSRLPGNIQKILLLNPMLHLIEFSRSSMSPPYVTVKYDLMYFFSWFIICMVFGLLLERYLRGRIKDK